MYTMTVPPGVIEPQGDERACDGPFFPLRMYVTPVPRYAVTAPKRVFSARQREREREREEEERERESDREGGERGREGENEQFGINVQRFQQNLSLGFSTRDT